MKTFGDRLLLALRAKGMTQRELAARTACCETVISFIIQGRRMPTFPQLRAILAELPEVDARRLITGDEETRHAAQ